VLILIFSICVPTNTKNYHFVEIISMNQVQHVFKNSNQIQ